MSILNDPVPPFTATSKLIVCSPAGIKRPPAINTAVKAWILPPFEKSFAQIVLPTVPSIPNAIKLVLPVS